MTAVKERKMGKKLEVVHGTKGNKDKTYRRRAKDTQKREAKKILNK